MRVTGADRSYYVITYQHNQMLDTGIMIGFKSECEIDSSQLRFNTATWKENEVAAMDVDDDDSEATIESSEPIEKNGTNNFLSACVELKSL